MSASFDIAKYAAACDSAASSQGLDPATVALEAAGIECGVEQTGGFTMVLVARDASATDHVFTITSDEDGDDEPLYLVVRQPLAMWHGDEDYDDERVAVLGDSMSAAQVAAALGRKS